MTKNRRDLDAMLERTVAEIRDDLPDEQAFAEAADRGWERLSELLETEGYTALTAPAEHEPIRGCDDVRALIPTYAAGELSEARALLIEDHTRECLPCRRALIAAREGRLAEAAAAPASGWSTGRATEPAEATTTGASRSRFGGRWMLAAAATVVLGLGVAILAALGVLPFGPGADLSMVATVESIDGDLYLVTDDGNRPLRAGDQIARSQEVRTARGSGAVVRLADGSRVELAERTEMAVRTGALVNRGDTTLDLDQGKVIVEAAKRSRGHLFVDTEDCRVAVTGTIFAVNHGTKGSRVSVIEGAVRVEQGRREDLLHPGDQVTTRATLTAVPLSDEIAWSQNLDHYLALLAELNALHEEIRSRVDAPLPRTSTALLDLAPAGTTIYAAVPNVAESMSEARQIFTERLASSPVLREALESSGSSAHQEELDRLIARIRDYGRYLGDEVAFAVVGSPDDHLGAAAYAEVLDPAAFRAFIEQEIARLATEAPEAEIVLVDDPDTLPAETQDDALYVWPTGGYVVASIGPDGLAPMAAALAGTATFAGSELHALLANAYADGVAWVFAMDLASMIDKADIGDEGFGFEDARHLLVQWSESGDRPNGRAVLAFDGPRHGIVSWLAEPAPMGSLEFVTADAAAAAAFVVREPLELVDELMAMLLRRDPDALAELERIETEQGFDLRQDLAAPLGGELAFALDGPLAPKPSFKVVVEVYDPARLQQTLEWAVDRLNQERSEEGGADGFALTSQEIGGRTVWALSTPAAGLAVYYTFVDSYLVAAPSTALLDTAIRARQTGAHLLASSKFRDLLPADGFTNFSAVVYQDLGSRLAPLAEALAAAREDGRELTDEERATLEQAGSLRPPTLGYAYGLEDRLVFAASIGGEGLMPLSALLGSGGSFAGLGSFGLLDELFADQSVEPLEGGP